MKSERGDAIAVNGVTDVAAHQDQCGTEVERDADGPEPPVPGRPRQDTIVMVNIAERRLDLCA